MQYSHTIFLLFGSKSINGSIKLKKSQDQVKGVYILGLGNGEMVRWEEGDVEVDGMLSLSRMKVWLREL